MRSSVFKVMLAAGLWGCAEAPEQTSYTDDSKETPAFGSGGGTRKASNLVNIPISVHYGTFGLTAIQASAYTLTLDDDPDGDPAGDSTCLSAYTATVDETSADGIEVYKDDRNCLAKLTAFEVGGIEYSAFETGATDFTTWMANDLAIFASSGGDTIRVKVISQLASPISGTEAIVYQFSELRDGTGDYVFSEANVSDPHSVTVSGQQAPLFNLIQASFTGMDDTSGAPEFIFKLECVDDPTQGTPTSVAMTDGTAADTVCGENDLADLTYKLIEDTYGSTLTIAQADAAFTTAGTSVTVPTDQYQDSGSNEGFNTVTLDGPGPLGTAGKANMILILKVGISYTYFNVDVTTITQ